jgi:ribosomal protein L24
MQVTQGPQQGQQGTVLDVLRKANRIIIDGVNMVRSPTTCLSLEPVVVVI